LAKYTNSQLAFNTPTAGARRGIETNRLSQPEVGIPKEDVTRKSASTFSSELEGRLRVVEKDRTWHYLMRGSSLKLFRTIKDGAIDLIVTDPPYNKDLNYGSFFKDKKKGERYYQWCRIWLKECARVLSDTGSFYLISYPEINARLLPYAEDALGLKFRRWLTWHYPTNIGHSKKNYTRSQRSILFFTRGDRYTFHRRNIIQHYKNPEVGKIKDRLKRGSKGRASYDLLRFADLIELSKGMIDVYDLNLLKNTSKDRFNKKHPCQLPLALLKRLIMVSSNKNDIVFDPFAGTFTLAAAALSLHRNSIGIEINPSYVRLGLKRLTR
jgi:DNA modification methylase